MKRILFIICLLCSVHLYAQQHRQLPDRQKIISIMGAQEAAWNRGDLEAFMDGYWNNDSLSFIGKKGITRGWKATLNNYKKSYPDKATMGKLTFDIVSVDVLGLSSAYVVGKWHLKRAKGDVGGHFTLLWKKIDGRWVIVSDHSS